MLFGLIISRIDQEAALERDEASFDPDFEERNYNEIARQLPVFCVSAKAYRTLRGLLKLEKLPAFRSVEDTQIPRV